MSSTAAPAAPLAALVARAEVFARDEMAGNDGSHDWEHVDRVRRMALKLARECGMQGERDLGVVELGALLHDVKDHKYAGGSAQAGPDAVRAFLEELEADHDVVKRVVHIVGNVSFSKQMRRDAPLEMTPELAVVQDADRLDSIGAVGVARCFTFGGTKNRALYKAVEGELGSGGGGGEAKAKAVMTGGAPADAESGVGHFYDKLLRIRDLMNTDPARKEAQRRHEFMVSFLAELDREVGLA